MQKARPGFSAPSDFSGTRLGFKKSQKRRKRAGRLDPLPSLSPRGLSQPPPAGRALPANGPENARKNRGNLDRRL